MGLEVIVCLLLLQLLLEKLALLLPLLRVSLLLKAEKKKKEQRIAARKGEKGSSPEPRACGAGALTSELLWCVPPETRFRVSALIFIERCWRQRGAWR